jgi:long-chain acyl-CoA synthetase
VAQRAVKVEPLGAGAAEAAQARAGGAFAEAGLVAGDRVAFCLPSSASLLCALLGAARRGVVPVLLNPTLTPDERRLLLDDAEPSLVIEDQRSLAALDDAAAVELSRYPLTRPMHYTSGTTGRPKGVTSGLWDEATSEQVFSDEADLWGYEASDVHLVCSPLYHSAGARFATSSLLRGGSCVVLDRFDAATVLAVLLERRPTTVFMVPSHLQRLLALRSPRLTEALSSLRLLVHAGEPCPPSIKERFIASAPSGAVFEFYGSTEGQFTVCTSAQWSERPGTVGQARPGRRLSVAATEEAPEHPGRGRALAPGEVGTVWCEAPPFARFSYWRDPAATEAAWRGEAFSVGDLGHLDADGYLFLSGRRHDLIISGGVNVYPAEVEAVLAAVPGVEEVAVFGVADERWGQRVCAAVVGRGPLEVVALEAAAAERLAPYKRPKQYVSVDELPHTATGKLRRDLVAHEIGVPPGAQPAGGPRSTTS